MKRKIQVGILVFDDVEVLDFAGPFEVFSRTRTTPGVESRRSDESAPFHVFTVAPRPGPGRRGRRAARRARNSTSRTLPPSTSCVVPGGFGTRPLLADAAVLDWLRRTAAAAQRVTSVCTGSLLLAQGRGCSPGSRATTHWSALDRLARHGSRRSRVDGSQRVVERRGRHFRRGSPRASTWRFAVVATILRPRGRQRNRPLHRVSLLGRISETLEWTRDAWRRSATASSRSSSRSWCSS